MQRETTILQGNNPASVARAAQVLAAGGLIGLPTETVYGLACNALDVAAVAGGFAAKARPSFDPLIVHTRDLPHAQTLGVFDTTAIALAKRFWPGPLTLVLPRKREVHSTSKEQGGYIVPDLVTAGLECVGLRVPDHAVAQAVLRASGLALAAPSANRFGSISPTTAAHVVAELSGELEWVLEGGPCRAGVESTVVSVEPGEPGEPGESGGASRVRVLRLGAIEVEAIELALPGIRVEVTKPTSAPIERSAEEKEQGAALPGPGMTDRHYAPRTPLRWAQDYAACESLAQHGRWGLIGFGDCSPYAATFAQVRSLSQSCDLTEAAARLFAVMRELDALALDGIAAVLLPEQGLGRAINDRLRRAGAPS